MPYPSPAPPLADVELQRAVTRLHRLGPRPMYEMVVELGARFLLRTEIERAVNRFAGIDPDSLEVAGGRDFAPVPMYCPACGAVK